MLAPAWPGVWVADHEIIRCVTNWGDHAPLIVHSFRGWVASETSASTIEGDPCMTRSASCAAGWPVQVADIAAHGGKSGVGVGNVAGDGLGLGLGDGGADGEAEADDVGLGWMTAAAVDPQAETTMTEASASSPTLRLTGHGNDEAWWEVTDRPVNTGAQG
jgi:hypothetical protein